MGSCRPLDLAVLLLLLWSTGYGEVSGEAGRSAGDSLATHPNWRYLSTEVCGGQLSDRMLVVGGEAKLKEYPWIARLGYQTRGQRKFFCIGSLIGPRYVLTAAHCVVGTGNMRVVSVRLGEHNTQTDPDCKEHGEEGTVCADPVQDFNVSEVIVHPEYDSNNRHPQNDIALVRLERDVHFTDYISPICLPYGAALSKTYESKSLIVAGWAITSAINRTSSPKSSVKLWASIPVMNKTQCSGIYQSHVTLTANQICAGGEGRGPCTGDAGGPLMSLDSVVPGRNGSQWVVSGVSSLGPTACATLGVPDVFTRVAPYVSWILDGLEP